MPTNYVLDGNATITRDDGRLIIQRDESRAESHPIARVDGLVLGAGVEIDRSAQDALVRRGAPIVFLGFDGEPLGVTRPAGYPRLDLRLEQMRAWLDPESRFSFAQHILDRKIEGQRRLLAQWAWKRDDALIREILGALDAARAAIPQAHRPPELRGIEGAAARAYFCGLATALPPGWSFERRSRRPPRDPFNALLGLGYVIAGRMVEAAIWSRGLDSHIGFLHEPYRSRPAFAFDLLEWFRAPLVDRWACWLASRRVLAPSDFENDPERGFRIADRTLFRRALRDLLDRFERPLPAGLGAPSRTARKAAGRWSLEFAQAFRRQTPPVLNLLEPVGRGVCREEAEEGG